MRKFRFAALAAAVLLIVAAVVYRLTDRTADTPEIVVLDVGEGSATLIRTAAGNVLIDAGPENAQEKLCGHLRQLGVRDFDLVIFTHPDEDHIGGLVPCIDDFSVSNIFGPDYVHTSNLFNNFMNTATANAIIVQYPSVGETFDFGTGSFTVLAPDGISQRVNAELVQQFRLFGADASHKPNVIRQLHTS